MASTRWLITGATLIALLACDDAAFDNPCDPANLDKGNCMTQVVDGAIPDAQPDAQSDMIVLVMASPDMAQVMDMQVADPDMRVQPLDLGPGIPEMGTPTPTDSVCTDGENSSDCVAGDCTQVGCMPGPVCDAESGRCVPPAQSDCLLAGCLNADYCGVNGHCIERCETAGCPMGRRCDLNTSRCVPAGDACQIHRFTPGCDNANEGECVAAGGEWGVWVDRGDSECKCPAPDAGCPCLVHDDCAGSCVVPADDDRICREGTRARCEEANFPEVCQCFARPNENGLETADNAEAVCPP